MKGIKSNRPEAYKEHLKQNWTGTCEDGIKVYRDQFGCRIYVYERHYLLTWRDVSVPTLSLQAAKEVSTILLNDKIMHTSK